MAASMKRTGELPRRGAAEALGTAFLLATVVGSGIMGVVEPVTAAVV